MENDENSGSSYLSRCQVEFIDFAGKGNLEQVERLGEFIYPDTQDAQGASALHKASEKGHFNIVHHLIKSCYADVNITDKWGKTPLHLASSKGHDDIVSLLLAHHASVNSSDKNKRTPLHYSLLAHNNECAKKLIEHGADVNYLNSDKISPFGTALLTGNNEMVGFFISKKPDRVKDAYGRGVVHHAVWGDNIRCLQTVLDALPKDKKIELVNERDNKGKTPLFQAVLNAHAGMVKSLVVSGARVNEQDTEKGRTPLLWLTRNLEGSVIHAESEQEYRKKSKARIPVERALPVIEALKSRGDLQTTIKDFKNMTVYDGIRRTEFKNSQDKDRLIVAIYGDKRPHKKEVGVL